MLTKYEAEVLQRSMHRELELNHGAVYKCAAGIVLVLVLSIAGPMIGVQADAAPQVVACALERLAGTAN